MHKLILNFVLLASGLLILFNCTTQKPFIPDIDKSASLEDRKAVYKSSRILISEDGIVSPLKFHQGTIKKKYIPHSKMGIVFHNSTYDISSIYSRGLIYKKISGIFSSIGGTLTFIGLGNGFSEGFNNPDYIMIGVGATASITAMIMSLMGNNYFKMATEEYNKYLKKELGLSDDLVFYPDHIDLLYTFNQRSSYSSVSIQLFKFNYSF